MLNGVSKKEVYNMKEIIFTVFTRALSIGRKYILGIVIEIQEY